MTFDPPSPQQPSPTVQHATDMFTKVKRLFPITNQEELKIYGVISAHNTIAGLINENSTQLILTGAYSMDEALRVNEMFMRSKIGAKINNHKLAVMVTSIPYVHAVPIGKMHEMITTIEKDCHPAKEIITKEKSTAEMEAYAKYIFDRAHATPYEKGILTNILNRFRVEALK